MSDEGLKLNTGVLLKGYVWKKVYCCVNKQEVKHNTVLSTW